MPRFSPDNLPKKQRALWLPGVVVHITEAIASTPQINLCYQAKESNHWCRYHSQP